MKSEDPLLSCRHNNDIGESSTVTRNKTNDVLKFITMDRTDWTLHTFSQRCQYPCERYKNDNNCLSDAPDECIHRCHLEPRCSIDTGHCCTCNNRSLSVESHKLITHALLNNLYCLDTLRWAIKLTVLTLVTGYCNTLIFLCL